MRDCVNRDSATRCGREPACKPGDRECRSRQLAAPLERSESCEKKRNFPRRRRRRRRRRFPASLRGSVADAVKAKGTKYEYMQGGGRPREQRMTGDECPSRKEGVTHTRTRVCHGCHNLT